MGEQPTDNLPPVPGRAAQPGRGAAGRAAGGVPPAGAGAGQPGGGATTREPELLTHEMSAGGYNYYADGALDDDPYGDHLDDGFAPQEPDELLDPEDEDDEQARKRKMWRRVRRSCYVAVAMMFVLPAVGFAVGYLVWNVDSPEAVAAQQGQTIDIKYANGQDLTKITPDDGHPRTMIHNAARDGSGDVPQSVINATLAAEDPTFYTNAGIDLQGIFRAVFAQLTGADNSGGSTITQEYIKLSTNQDQHTYTRKFKEIVLAVKMTQEQPKDEILKAYLNTAYYGRGAYGIYNAAEAFFGKTPKQLTNSEAAVLAGMVQSPTYNDPATNPQQGQSRWTYVADNMAKFGLVSPQDRAEMQFPQTRPPQAWLSGSQNITAAQYQIRQQVLWDLASKGYSQDTLSRGGYTITTTIDPNAEQAAQAAVTKYMTGQPANIKPSLVAIDPKTGGVKAYYGGNDVGGFDYANDPQPPGSSFKPFVVTAGLELNPPAGIGQTYNGTSPQQIAGTQFANDPSVVCNGAGVNIPGVGPHDPAQCGVREAMTKSVNTVFVNMAVQFQTQNVQKAAQQAGIPQVYQSPGIPQQFQGQKTLQDANGVVEAGIALGQYPVRPLDMAGAYATFANEGMRIPPHFVASISNYAGTQTFDNDPQVAPQPAFASDQTQSKNVADNVTATLLDVADHSKVTLAGNRPVASKSGTNQYGNGGSPENANAWYVGYTPQITTAVAMLADNNGQPAPLKDKSGSNLYGATLSGPIWRDFMNAYLAHLPVVQFPKPVPIGQFEPVPPPPPPPPPTSDVPSSTLPPTTSDSSDSNDSQEPSYSRRSTPPGTTCGLLGCYNSGGGGGGGPTGTTTTPTPTPGE